MQVLPMPDELAIAHLGRISYIKASRTTSSRNTNISQFRKVLTESGREKAFVTQLAEHSGMSPTDYAAQHSMLSALRPATRRDSHLLYGDRKNDVINRMYGLDLPKKGGYLCPHCVEDDVAQYGISWFKRSHHLEGINWCPRHRTPLMRVVSANPWTQIPGSSLSAGNVSPESTGYYDDDTGFLERCTEISLALLGKTKPYFVCDLGMMLGLRVKLRMASMGASATGVLLSDMVKAAVPSSWATKHWPELMEKAPGEHLQGLDSVITNIEVPISCLAYSAILATLFDTSAEALELLSDLDQQRFLSSISNWVNQSNQTEENPSCLDCAV